jgi:hypothetical protein
MIDEGIEILHQIHSVHEASAEAALWQNRIEMKKPGSRLAFHGGQGGN